jgi:hypothetical protein
MIMGRVEDWGIRRGMMGLVKKFSGKTNLYLSAYGLRVISL